jgi:hypothetical protein
LPVGKGKPEDAEMRSVPGASARRAWSGNHSSSVRSFYDPGSSPFPINEEPHTLSRFRIAVLFATVAALAAVLAACGGGGGNGSSEDPQTVIDNATLEGVKSGSIDMHLGIKSTGEEGGDLTVSLSGPFQAGASKGDLPEFSLSAKANGTIKNEAVDFEGDLTLLSDRAFVGFNGKEYEVDPTTFGFVKSAFEQAQQQGGGIRRQPEERRQR